MLCSTDAHMRRQIQGCLEMPTAAPFYGPGFVNTDFSAIKHFALPYREGHRVGFPRGVFQYL